MPPCIAVLAGTNGAGKSSIGGATIRREKDGSYFNPDDEARTLREEKKLSHEDANAQAWQLGKTTLELAIRDRFDFSFETTLGGNTIPRLLADAATQGIEIRIWYAGLATVEMHIERVKERVRKGGHDIPEKDIRARYVNSIQNLIRLLPCLTELAVYDNSLESDPDQGGRPGPRLVFRMEYGRIVEPAVETVDSNRSWAKWAEGVIDAALAHHRALPA